MTKTPFLFFLMIWLALLGGCVSSSLNSVKETEAQSAAEPTYDLALREEAVAEMRAKAENQSGEKTNVFKNQDGPGRPMTQEEVDLKVKALRNRVKSQSKKVSDVELTEKAKIRNNLRKRARTHYQNRVKKIEN